MSETLQPFTDFQKKSKFKTHLKKEQFKQNFKESMKLIAFGISGQIYDDYVNYYTKFKCITNKEELVMKEEKEECF